LDDIYFFNEISQNISEVNETTECVLSRLLLLLITIVIILSLVWEIRRYHTRVVLRGKWIVEG